ncbi:MAG: bifunctional nuclease family protein [Acidobacteria bacterium]|nr:bifunctional nuclease family protein [Acidobacteriota bacterium]MBI3656188.1 bifunctional nuclease family protein [Acidobacteriota bacterium]
MRLTQKTLLCALTFLALVYLARVSGKSQAERRAGDFTEVAIATMLDTGDESLVILKETQGERYLAIAIGDPETRAILIGMEQRRPDGRTLRLERPLTHNLLLNIMDKLGARLDRIVVTDLKNNTYYADIYLKAAGSKEIKVDSRPSDAIALAITIEKPIPIFVSSGLMARAGKKGLPMPESDAKDRRNSIRL